MGLVLWIDQNTFASDLLERVFKKKDLPFYTISSVLDFSYLVEDLNPEVIVLDTETALANLQIFKDQYLASAKMQNTPFILIGESSEVDSILKKIGVIKRPFDPFKMPELLAEILKKH